MNPHNPIAKATRAVRKGGMAVVTAGGEFYKGRWIYAFWVLWTATLAISGAWRHEWIFLVVQIPLLIVNVGFLYAKPKPIAGPPGKPGDQGAPAYELPRKRLKAISERMGELVTNLEKNPTPVEMASVAKELQGIFDELAGDKKKP